MNFLRTFFLLLFITAINMVGFAQVDSINPVKTPNNSALPANSGIQKRKTNNVTDTTTPSVNTTKAIIQYDSVYRKYMIHPYLPMTKKPVFMVIDYKKKESKDMYFYLLLGIIAFLAFIRMFFPKYYKALFELFFQTSMRQKQYKDQLQQDYIASFLINVLFIFSTGLFITLYLLCQKQVKGNFWTIYGYAALILSLIYTGKYIFLSFAGWVFDNKSAAQGYIFLVSLMNRIMGIYLIPFSVFLALGDESTHGFFSVTALILIIITVLYRYFVSFGAIRNELKINALHFFLYLCAVEIMPIALIYKLLMNYFN